MKATIKGVYFTKQDGEPLQYGPDKKPFAKLLLSFDNRDSHYEAVFPSERAFFRVTDLYASAGKPEPSFSSFGINDLEELIGSEIDVAMGKNDKGYDTVKKYFKKGGSKKAEPVEQPAPATVPADLDEDEDVPF